MWKRIFFSIMAVVILASCSNTEESNFNLDSTVVSQDTYFGLSLHEEIITLDSDQHTIEIEIETNVAWSYMSAEPDEFVVVEPNYQREVTAGLLTVTVHIPANNTGFDRSNILYFYPKTNQIKRQHFTINQLADSHK